MHFLLLLVIGLSISMLSASAVAQPSTVLTCAFPNSFIGFSVYSLNVSEAPIHADSAYVLHGFDSHINFNPSFHPRRGLVYSSDINGSTAVYDGSGAVLASKGSSFNDRASWDCTGKRLVFSSTREENLMGNAGWNAVYLFDREDNSTVRITPPNVTDYSPAWASDCSSRIAVASGSGKPHGTSIVVIDRDGSRRTVVADGGWPTWRSDDAIVFHRLNGSSPSDTWNIHQVNLTTREETILVQGAMTPMIQAAADAMVFAFIDPNGWRQLGWMDLKTDRREQLTSDHTHHYSPFLTEEGLVFFHKQRCHGEAPNIRRMKSDADAVHELGVVHGDFPSLSPDGESIALIDIPDFNSLSMMNADGTNRRIIRNNWSWMTSWVNQSTIAFTDGPAFALSNFGPVQVATISPDGSNMKQLTSDPNHNQGYPCYSPEGTRIVYRTAASVGGTSPPNWHLPYMPGQYHLAIMNSDGSNQRLLIPPDMSNGTFIGDTHPHWGANDTIVFASDRGHPQRLSIWTVKADGSELKEIFDHGAMSVHPSMTPDGSTIIFTSTYAGYTMELIAWPFAFVAQAEVFTMTINGSSLKRVTHDTCENANVWVGTQRLPPLSAVGMPNTCTYRDSAEHRTPTQEGRESVAEKTKRGLRRFPHGTMVLPEEFLKQLETEDSRASGCPYRQ